MNTFVRSTRHCRVEGCDTDCEITYVDKHGVPYQFCLKHVNEWIEAFKPTAKYCVHRVGFLLSVSNAMVANDIVQTLPPTLDIGECTLRERLSTNEWREPNAMKRLPEVLERQRQTKENYICDCNNEGKSIHGYQCAYADITDPEREQKKIDSKARFKARFEQLKLL